MAEKADFKEVAEENFLRHSQKDSALTASTQTSQNGVGKGRTTLLGKILIFIVFPTLMGFFGLYIGYLETSREDADRELSFDQDFALPFALALGLALAIFVQTGGLATTKPKSLISWPKVKKSKKIVHKHVVKGQSPDVATKISEEKKNS